MKILAQSKTAKKTYKCPYCDQRTIRTELADHIEKKHYDLIPEGYTANRTAFNYLNKKTEGHCIMCGDITLWNEEKCRYERLCEKKSCHDKYVKMTNDRLKNSTGKTKEELLSDPEHQNKMLAARSISGKYKFSDGGVIPYVGTYEKDFLQFMDTVLNVQSTDIVSPGPTIEYYHDGQKHLWITDFWYLPYNIVFDIKDGGNNPNNRQMAEYRAKQNSKERAIANLNKYNYLRLTDKQYDQLLELMMDLKEDLLVGDPTADKKIRIYEQEECSASAYTVEDPCYIFEKGAFGVYTLLNMIPKESASIVFDLGGVLVDGDMRQSMQDDPDIPNDIIDDLMKYWITDDPREETWSTSDHIAMAERKFPLELQKYIPLVLKHSISCFYDYPYAGSLIDFLKEQGYHVYYLSNWSKWHSAELINAGRLSFLDRFDGGIFSWQVGCMKPDRKIYKTFCEVCDVNPKAAVFFDDKLDNINAAKQFGMNAIQFTEVLRSKIEATDFQYFTSSKLSESVDMDILSEFNKINEIPYGIFKTVRTDRKNMKSFVKFVTDNRDEWKQRYLENKNGRYGIPGSIEEIIYMNYTFEELSRLARHKNREIYIGGGRFERMYGYQLTTNDYCINLDKKIIIKYSVRNSIYSVDDLTKLTISDIAKQHSLYMKIFESCNESTTTMGTMAPTNGSDNVYIVNYMMNNAFTGRKEKHIGICKDKMTCLHIMDEKKKKAKPIALHDLKDVAEEITMFKYDNKVNFDHIIEHATSEEDFIRLLVGNTINENVLINTKDFEYNLDKWKPGTNNILFITGLSGSGKSTKAAKLAKEKDAVNIEVDLFEYNQIVFDPTITQDEGNLIIKSFFEKKHKGAYKYPVDKNNEIIDSDKFASELCEFIRFVIDYAKKNKNKLFVVEGIQIMDTRLFDIVSDYPVIVVGTSMINSIFRAAKREGSLLKYFKFDTIGEFKAWLNWYMSDEKLKKQFIKKMNVKSIDESVDKSSLDKNFEKKSGKKFKYIDIKNNKSKVDRYLSKDKTYKNTYKQHIDEIIGEIAIDEESDKLAGYVFVIDKFITPVFVLDKYRGYGLGDTLVRDAVTKYGATRLWVYKDNEVAIRLYEKYGFKIYIEDDEPTVLMAIDKKYAENINESTNIFILTNLTEYRDYSENKLYELVCENGKPNKCTKCGSTEIGVYIQGEPIYKCKKCGEYLGTIPCSPHSESTVSDEIFEILESTPFTQVPTQIDILNAISEVVLADMKRETTETHSIPILSLFEAGRPYNYYRDIDGVYIQHELTKMRSKSYDDINIIPEYIFHLVSRGYI